MQSLKKKTSKNHFNTGKKSLAFPPAPMKNDCAATYLVSEIGQVVESTFIK